MKFLRIAIGLVLLISCRSKEVPTNEDDGTSQYSQVLQRSEVEGVFDSVYSGYKEVFENRDTKSKRIRIFVLVLPARTDSIRSPIFYFEGGPGQAATLSAPFYQTLRSIYRNRDIVLIDIRGTGKSNGLYCPSLQFDPQRPSDALDDVWPVEKVRACLAELNNIADLTQYSTANAIEDVEEIRLWLGYKKINIVGGSYGTRACESYLRQYPGSIRSAVMVGAAPGSMRRPQSFAQDSQRAWELICRDCAIDKECATQFPNLDAEFNALLSRLDKSPASIQYRNPINDQIQDLIVRRGMLTEVIRTIMYSSDGQRRLPHLIHQAAIGNFTPLVSSAIRRARSYNSLSKSFYLCVTCSEDVPFLDSLEWNTLSEGTFLGDYRLKQESGACKQWPRYTVGSDHGKPVKTDIPVLIVSGSHDPVTPPRWATVMSAQMTHASLVTVEYMSHGEFGLSRLDCLPRSFSRFFDHPEKGFQIPCVKEMVPGSFRVE